jgi:hypothetical protein
MLVTYLFSVGQVVEHSGTVELSGLRLGEAPAVAATAIARLVRS